MTRITLKNNSLIRSSAASQRGQVVVEAVLLLVFVVGMWQIFSKYAARQKWFESLVSGPWQSMSGMIEAGVWGPPNRVNSKHPNSFDRVVSLKE